MRRYWSPWYHSQMAALPGTFPNISNISAGTMDQLAGTAFFAANPKKEEPIGKFEFLQAMGNVWGKLEINGKLSPFYWVIFSFHFFG